MNYYGNQCFNPFHLPVHRKTKNLRKISMGLATKWRVSSAAYVCEHCRKRLSTETPPEIGTDPVLSQSSVTSSECSQTVKDELFIPEEKHNNKSSQTDNTDDYEILKQLKEKFNDPSTSASTKTLILTIAPKSWSANKLAEEFGASRRQTNKAKHLVDQHGVLTTPNPRSGTNKLPVEIENLVRSFYLREDVSRILPGKKDFVSVKLSDGTRSHIQKQLILSNIEELYQVFKTEYPDVKIGLTKFYTLRPKQCILAGDSGTHLVCVCTYHQNAKLMLSGGDIDSLTSGTNMHLTSYKDCLRMMMCPNPKPICHLTTSKSTTNERCASCPGPNQIREHLKTVFDDNQITSVQFEQWIGTDRYTITTQILPSDDFVDNLCQSLDVLKPHAYIAEQQSSYFKTLKDTLAEGEILVQCDFAENYSFVIQDAVQSYHWNNEQATILTSVYYYREGNQTKHESIVMISNDLKHDTATFYEFQKQLHQYLLNKGLIVKKIIYSTDGASQHFKNRFNFINLCHYKEDFDSEAEIHFHATAHGKGPCDGVGGNLKRLAIRASLQLPASKAITTPERLYEWAKSALTETVVLYSSKEDLQTQREFLQQRFESAVTIPGTKKYHAFIPTINDDLIVRRTSYSENYKIVKVSK